MPRGRSFGCPARISIPLLRVGVVSLLDEVVLGLVVSLLDPPFIPSPSLAPGLRPRRGEPPEPPKAFPDPSLEFKLDFRDSTLAPAASLAISYGLKGTGLLARVCPLPPSLTMIVGEDDDFGTDPPDDLFTPFRSPLVIDFCLSRKGRSQDTGIEADKGETIEMMVLLGWIWLMQMMMLSRLGLIMKKI